MDGTWYLDFQTGCQWAGGYQFDPFTNPDLPPGCTEPYPCAGSAFPGSPCYVVNSGWVTLYFSAAIVGDDLVFTLLVLNYALQSGYGYVCGAQYSASVSVPKPAPGESFDASDWTEMFGVDDSPLGANKSCGWIEHEAEGNTFPATVSIKFKAAA